MRFSLSPHPQSHARAADAIDVDVQRRDDALALLYRLTGDIADVVLPAPAAAVRTDELWRNTCFEAFLGAADAPGYLEFNFAPSTRWAAYAFDGYRTGMRNAPLALREIVCTRGGDRLELRAILPLAGLPPAPWRLGLSAVIEAIGGQKSYWALAHPPGAPDFHHADCFVGRVPAA